jgi:DNA ligase (NAD+)
MSTQIADLNTQILAAREAYYKGEPLMSDEEYDVLEAQLKGLVKAQPQMGLFATALQTPGHAKATGRIKHARPMLSIENYYTMPEVVEWAKKIRAADTFKTPLQFCVEPKRDGISNVIKYDENGWLKQALTRGDGEAGEDITPQVKACHRIPQQVFIPNLEVRGELVMRKSTLAAINAMLLATQRKPYASTRNLTAGTMKQQDLTIVASRDIEFMPWDVSGIKSSDSNFERMELLTKQGFPAYEGHTTANPDEIPALIEKVLKQNEASDIVADGVVVKVNEIARRKTLGVGSTYTNYQICFKPQNQVADTHL